MADQRTMAELLRAPTEGYAEAIVVPPTLTELFELKDSLINMMTSDQFFGLEMDNPHDHICWFNKITSTIKYKDVPNSAIKLMLFPFSLAGAAHRTTNLRNEISNFQQLFDESFHEAWDRYKDLLRACHHYGFTELHQLDTFYNALNSADHDSLNSAAGGNLLERRTQDVLTIIENKSKIAKLTHAVNQQSSVVTTIMAAILKQFQATPPPASVKVVEEICVTCGGAHPYYQCLAADGNTFSEPRDNIQGYVAAAVNYNQGNSSYRPPVVANQIRPPGFAQSNVQNNQNRFSQPQGYNRGNNFNQDQPYQAPTQPNQVVPLSELEKVKKINETNMKAMQTQINNVKNKLRNEMKNSIQASMSNQTNELKNMMASFFQMNTASTSGSLPSNTIANLKGELKAIPTRSGIVLDGPSAPILPPFINSEEDERVEETLTDQDLAEDTLHPNIPYPSRMLKQKQQEKDEVQIHKFWQMFKQLHINITLTDALILILKYQKMLKALLSNKEKLLELENIPLNENSSAVIDKKLPEKLGDPWKFLILCGFSELKCKALADLGTSINLMPLSVWKKLGLPELISTRMTLKLANRAICTSAGIARDVFILVGKFTFPADIVIVDYESDPRVPLILGRPFLQTACTLIDVHGEEMILHDGDERLTLNMRHDTSSYSNQPQNESINMINIYDDSSEDFLKNLFSTNHQSGNPTFSSHHGLTSLQVKDDIFDPEGGNVLFKKLLDLDSTKDLHPLHHVSTTSSSSSSPNQFLEEFADGLALITFPSGNDDLLFYIESNLKKIEYLLHYDPIKDIYSIRKDSIDQSNLVDLNDNLVDTMPEMITNEHALDYSSLSLYDEYDDDLFEVDDFLPSPEYDSFLLEDFSEVDALPSANNKDKVFNPCILIGENLFEVITRVAQDKNEKKLAISHASVVLEDFDPSLYSPSAKRTSWNEFSSAMASAVICLSTDSSVSRNKEAKKRVKKLEKENRDKLLRLQRLKRVGTSQRVDTSEDTVMDDVSNQGRKIDELDEDDAVSLMDDKEEDKKDEEAKVVEDDQVQGRQAESQAEIYKIDLDHALKVLKVVTAASETITAASIIISAAEPQVTAATKTDAPVKVAAASTKRKKEWLSGIQKKNQLHLRSYEESRALQSINETLAQKVAKRRKLNEEVEDLKRHLEIMPDEDDDVYTEATLLARKLIFLVERRYPLSRFTLDQMLNVVRLRVEEETKMSLEQLRFTRQQHQEGQLE
nr:hypothetical protein [Tanacetum cinerariifolium]